MKTHSAVHRLRLVSVPEAISFLLLLTFGSALKRLSDGDIDLVMPLGLLHGVLFIGYVVLWVLAWRSADWGKGRAAWYFVLAVLPTGGFFADRMLREEERRSEHADPAGAVA